ncbi:hypothetical protein [Mycolicibacterium chubuense]|uniref:baeRF2 domain-containing protein n=1 Tax=Mycolicibacterium chubuense TaxID=1800 RepID=UPI001300F6CB|nr:hypothetical protein [Mycolicibacterium chubuense]
MFARPRDGHPVVGQTIDGRHRRTRRNSHAAEPLSPARRCEGSVRLRLCRRLAQHRRRGETIAAALADVADEVAAAFDDSDPKLVFVVGEARSRADLISNLPKRVGETVVDTMDEAAQRFQAEVQRGSGLATEGLPGVCAALREGAVETLLVGEIGEATVLLGDTLTTVAPTPELMSELGAGDVATVRAAHLRRDPGPAVNPSLPSAAVHRRPLRPGRGTPSTAPAPSLRGPAG